MRTSTTLSQEHAQQELFRKLMHAMSYPGSIASLPENDGLLTLVACLADRHASLCAENDLLCAAQLRLLGAQSAPQEHASFLLLDGDKEDPKTCKPKRGSLIDPHEGATVFLNFEYAQDKQADFRLSGPGIKESLTVSLPAAIKPWLVERNAWVSDLPMGVDIVVVFNHFILALPRTTQITTL